MNKLLIALMLCFSILFCGCSYVQKGKELAKSVILKQDAKKLAVKLGKKGIKKLVERLKDKSSEKESAARILEVSQAFAVGLAKLEQSGYVITLDGLDSWFKNELKLEIDKYKLVALKSGLEVLIEVIREYVDGDKSENVREIVKEFVKSAKEELDKE